MAIRIGIVGYGNLGRGVEAALAHNPDLQPVAVFTRRAPASISLLHPSTPVVHFAQINDWQKKIDVLLLCGGSASDLPTQTPLLARDFCLVDSYDRHADIQAHFLRVDAAAKQGQRTAIISAGWDPGLFSLNRLLAQVILPDGKCETFWGKGVSQGHSDAVRRIAGVKDARQYTLPISSALDLVRSGAQPALSARQKHRRLCYVVAEDGADTEQIAATIKNMPDYFADFDTQVNFISEAELKKEHTAMPHGGFVISSGTTSGTNSHLMEFSLKLDSNPEFTAGVLLAYARAAWRLHKRREYGCKTVFDIPIGLLSPRGADQLRQDIL